MFDYSIETIKHTMKKLIFCQ